MTGKKCVCICGHAPVSDGEKRIVRLRRRYFRGFTASFENFRK